MKYINCYPNYPEENMSSSLKAQIKSVTKEVNALYYRLALQKNNLSMFINLYTTTKSRNQKIKLKQNIWKIINTKNLQEVVGYWQATVNLELRNLFFKKIKRLIKHNMETDRKFLEILILIFEFHEKK